MLKPHPKDFPRGLVTHTPEKAQKFFALRASARAVRRVRLSNKVRLLLFVSFLFFSSFFPFFLFLIFSVDTCRKHSDFAEK